MFGRTGGSPEQERSAQAGTGDARPGVAAADVAAERSCSGHCMAAWQPAMEATRNPAAGRTAEHTAVAAAEAPAAGA